MARRHSVALLIGTVAALPGFASAQTFPDDNGAALAGVTAFDTRFFIGTWLSVETDREVFQQDGQRIFDAGVSGAGASVESSAPNYLFCAVYAAQRGETVFYFYSVDFHEYQADGLQNLLWTDGGVASIASDSFSPDEVAGDCIDSFSTEWRRQNP